MVQKLLNLNKAKLCALSLVLSMPLMAFSQNTSKEKERTTKKDNRVEINFKQRHSKSDKHQSLYADGIKIKKDISLIDKVQESRILDMDEIPADEIYGGIWSNTRVNAYSSLESIPDSFKVNLKNFTMPTMGYVTSNFGPRKRRMHYGIDLKVQVGDTIYAAFDGKIRLCQFERRGYGNYVVMRHTNGLESVYGHLSGFLVKEDDAVRAGDPIALGGNTGRSTGAHLHLEFRFLGKPINPNKIVDFDNKVCHRDHYVVTNSSFDSRGAANSSKYARSSSAPNKYVSGKVNYYKVRKGDTLSKIAQRNRTTVAKLTRLNKLSQKATLRTGQALRIS